jgi:hypothetical protein
MISHVFTLSLWQTTQLMESELISGMRHSCQKEESDSEVDHSSLTEISNHCILHTILIE